MALENEIRLVGFCGLSPVCKVNVEGRAMAKVPVYTEHTKRFNGTTRIYKEVHTCLFFGKNAEHAERLLLKGSQVYIVGYMHYHRFEQDGQVRKFAQVIVDEFKITTKATMTREIYDRIFGEEDDKG